MCQQKPIDCVLAVTYRCNSRCTMCDIWKIKDFPEIPAGEFKKLPRSLKDINISGGEPFLRPDLPEIIRNVVMACPQARIVISTNGFATDLIIGKMKEILKIKPDIGVAVSIDGLKTTHEELRGIPGGFDKAMATVAGLKKLGVTNLRLGFTLLEKNVNQLSKVYDLSRELGVQFAHSFAQSSDIYFGGKQNINHPRLDLARREYGYIIKQELKTWNLKRWLRAYFAHGMFNFISSHNPVISNAPGRDFFFMDPSGAIYPSVVHNALLGNMRDLKSVEDGKPPTVPLSKGDKQHDSPLGRGRGGLAGEDSKQTFSEFWRSKNMEAKRKQVDAMEVPVWMICTARSAMKRHPFRVLGWILKNKFFLSSP